MPSIPDSQLGFILSSNGILSADLEADIFLPCCDSYIEKLIGNGIFLAWIPPPVRIQSHWLPVFQGLQNKHI